MTERKGIEIDYCPKCRGVWLDRGELDKFVQQSERQSRDADGDVDRADSRLRSESNRFSEGHEPPRYPLPERGRRDDDDYRRYPPVKRKESFWGELFDFD
jgi:hypothetical protein